MGRMAVVFQDYVCPVCNEAAVGEWFVVSNAYQKLNRSEGQWKQARCPNGHEMSPQQLDQLRIGPNFPPG
jgi:hypothetical protein